MNEGKNARSELEETSQAQDWRSPRQWAQKLRAALVLIVLVLAQIFGNRHVFSQVPELKTQTFELAFEGMPQETRDLKVSRMSQHWALAQQMAPGTVPNFPGIGKNSSPRVITQAPNGVEGVYMTDLGFIALSKNAWCSFQAFLPWPVIASEIIHENAHCRFRGFAAFVRKLGAPEPGEGAYHDKYILFLLALDRAEHFLDEKMACLASMNALYGAVVSNLISKDRAYVAWNEATAYLTENCEEFEAALQTLQTRVTELKASDPNGGYNQVADVSLDKMTKMGAAAKDAGMKAKTNFAALH